MQELLKLKDITFEILDNIIFKNVNGTVHDGDVIGIIGKNGVGKTTLLQIISGNLSLSNGKINWLKPQVSVEMVEQETEDFASEHTGTKEAQMLAKWNVLTNSYSKLSGGEKLKVRLAKGFSRNAQLLLLDEPTNHLDEQSTEILIEHIKQYKGTIILISHDRYFLDKVVTKIWSLEDQQLIEHKGNYTSYMKAREQRRLTQKRDYEKQQQMIQTIEGQLKELTSWSQKAHADSTKQEGMKEYHRVKAKRTDAQIKSKRKRLEKELEKSKVEQVKPEYEVQFTLKANDKRGKRFLEVKTLQKSLNKRVLFKDVSFTIQHGEKLALVGPNGSGKTTFLKIVMGEVMADAGEVWISPAAKIGYLTQEVFDLPLLKTPEELFYRETFEERGKVQNLMKHLGFSTAAWKEPIGNMSMGERVKCKLMVYILEEKDVLMLDEPTNHLDLPSREQLEETLSTYNGTLLIVSHDRYFLEKTTNSSLEIKNKSIHKQLKEMPAQKDTQKEALLKLETERQEVLGKLSFMTVKDSQYPELDAKFSEITKQINQLKKNM
ncbi:ribosomal protection-like ABC-F family protein [Ureibacillus chungkukjangi]|uniref:Ribosome protection protein VmlR n=1 Tax=Ureibacillus chungkukjangi TaxID=1202712 RepID=A0A318TP41_9BACL|nr:ABC-F type ribosomal protection protein [Ureibacillus chungkukjangi]MCM3388751.1 ABC-F type ribosomal protection protein [Ureibacillus chungkukjangi]PYF06661.1 macrolide transport system ATP-binding/permease protein [Ureibacillus chungkukjangi]